MVNLERKDLSAQGFLNTELNVVDQCPNPERKLGARLDGLSEGAPKDVLARSFQAVHESFDKEYLRSAYAKDIFDAFPQLRNMVPSLRWPGTSSSCPNAAESSLHMFMSGIRSTHLASFSSSRSEVQSELGPTACNIGHSNSPGVPSLWMPPTLRRGNMNTERCTDQQNIIDTNIKDIRNWLSGDKRSSAIFTSALLDQLVAQLQLTTLQQQPISAISVLLSLLVSQGHQ